MNTRLLNNKIRQGRLLFAVNDLVFRQLAFYAKNVEKSFKKHLIFSLRYAIISQQLNINLSRAAEGLAL